MRKFLLVLIACFLITGALWGQSNINNIINTVSDKLDKVADIFDTSVNMEEDYYLGRAVAANILGQPGYRIYYNNPRLTYYLNEICQTLIVNSPDNVLFNGYHVAILDTMEYNAFATPGGHIMISRGLVEAATSEDALASLIAHEVAHIILRHAAKIIDEMALASELNEIAEKALELSENSKAAQQAIALRKATAPIINTMIKNGFSKEQEYEADAKALELLNAAGYDPRALLDMLQILQRVQSSRRGGFNDTHPSPRDRIIRVNIALSKYGTNNTQAVRKPRFINK